MFCMTGHLLWYIYFHQHSHSSHRKLRVVDAASEACDPDAAISASWLVNYFVVPIPFAGPCDRWFTHLFHAVEIIMHFFNALGYMLLARNSILSKNTNSLSFGVFTQSTSRGQTANLRPPERSITRCSSRSQQIISGTADALYPPCHTLEMSPVKTSPRWHVYNSAGVILSTRSPRSVVSLTVKRQNPFLRRAGTACS